MSRIFVKRDAGVIVSMTKWPHPRHPDQIDDTDQEYLDFVIAHTKEDFQTPKVPGNSGDKGAAAAHERLDALEAALVKAGVLAL